LEVDTMASNVRIRKDMAGLVTDLEEDIEKEIEESYNKGLFGEVIREQMKQDMKDVEVLKQVFYSLCDSYEALMNFMSMRDERFRKNIMDMFEP
jgi:hypothetical protein